MIRPYRILLLVLAVAVGATPFVPVRAYAALPAGGMSAAALNAAFTSYGDTSGRWSGADSTASVALPDGRLVWLFADTFLGPVDADHSRPRTAPFINNSMVVQDGTQLVATRHGGSQTLPEALVKPEQAGEFYWVADGTVEAGALRVLYNRYRKTGSDMFDFALVGTALATFDLPGLTVRGVSTLPLGATTSWGSSILEDGGFTYVYGTEGTADGLKFARLARVPAGGLGGAWQFWTGSGWSANESASVRLFSGVGTSFGVQKVGSQYVYVTQETSLPFHPGVVAYTAPAPTGPFTGPVPLFTAPEPVPGNEQFVYDARVHPDLARPGKLLVSYNVNSLDGDANYADARIYRPRFVEVDWPRPAPDPGRPAAPAGLTATMDQADAAVLLSWQAPAGTDLRYRVYQRDVTAGQTHFARQAGSTAETATTVGMVRSGHRYEFMVAAENAAGEGPTSAVAAITPDISPPPAPGGVTAAAQPDGSVLLGWAAVPHAWSYSAHLRDVTAGETGFRPAGQAGSGATSLRVDVLVQDHRYEFHVTAQHGGGVSAPSAKVQATSHANPPATPTGLTAATRGDGQIDLSWTASAGAGSYWVYQRDVTAGETGFVRLGLPILGTAMTAGFLAHGHEYEFRVTADNRGGESPPSGTARATSRYPLPAAPANLRATAGSGEVALAWDDVGLDAYYWVYQRDVTAGESEFTKLPIPILGRTTMTAGYLANGHEYEYRVTAQTAAGEGPASATVRATPRLPLPGQPTGLTATANADGTITLAWAAPGPGLWYNVYERDATIGEGWRLLGLPVTEGTTMTAGGLTHQHVYQYQVAGTNAAGEGPRSGTAQATARYSPPAAPANLRGRSAGDGSVELTWDPPAPRLFFWVYQRDVTAGETAFTRAALPRTDTSAHVGFLRHGHVYEFKVTGENQGGEGPASGPAQVTAYGGLPAPPSGLTAAAGDGQVALNWSASPTPGVIYVVHQRDVTAGQSWQELPLPVSTCCTMTPGYLTNGHWYEFKVTAVNGSGHSEASNVVSARPMPPIPAPPTGLTATAGDAQVTLRWTASPTPNVWYWVEYRTGGGAWQRTRYPVSTCCTFTLGYLTNGATYQFRLRSTNLSGDSAPSTVATARPMPPIPQAPRNLSAVATGDPAINLSWTASTTSSVFYLVEYRLTGDSGWTRMALPVASCCSFRADYLRPSHDYQFRIFATNLAGDSAPSNVAGARTTITPPAAPGFFSALPSLQRAEIVMSWGAAPTATAYTVQASRCGEYDWVAVKWMLTVRTWQMAYPGCWHFRVLADRYGVYGPPSNIRTSYRPSDDYPWPTYINWDRIDPWYFVKQQCTSFAAWRINQYHRPGFNLFWRQPERQSWGHAKSWDEAAGRAGVPRGSGPVIGTIMQRDGGDFGHVAFVAAIDGDYVYVEQYNAVPNRYSIELIYWPGSGLEFLYF